MKDKMEYITQALKNEKVRGLVKVVAGVTAVTIAVSSFYGCCGSFKRYENGPYKVDDRYQSPDSFGGEGFGGEGSGGGVGGGGGTGGSSGG
ncbi:MAG: hypothetical protein V1888_03040 [archaeon]